MLPSKFIGLIIIIVIMIIIIILINIIIIIIIVIIMIRCVPALKLLDLSSCDLDSIPSLRSNTLTTLNISSNRLSELHTGDADDDVDYDEDSQS